MAMTAIKSRILKILRDGGTAKHTGSVNNKVQIAEPVIGGGLRHAFQVSFRTMTELVQDKKVYKMPGDDSGSSEWHLYSKEAEMTKHPASSYIQSPLKTKDVEEPTVVTEKTNEDLVEVLSLCLDRGKLKRFLTGDEKRRLINLFNIDNVGMNDNLNFFIG